MNEQIIYDLVTKIRASLWSSIEDTIEELPAIVEQLRHANSTEDVEELLGIVMQELSSARTFFIESGTRISALEDIKTKVVESLSDHQSTLPEEDVEALFTDTGGDSVNPDGTFK